MSRKLVLLAALIIVLVGTSCAAFDIQRVKASGTIYIRANGDIEGTDKIERVGEYGYIFTDNISDEIVVERDNITVNGAGYTLQGTGIGTGISLTERSNVTIKNMEIIAFHYGIWLEYSSDCCISSNNITKNNKFDAVFVKNRQEALQSILDSIPTGSVVGAGDSLTLKEIGIFKELKRRNFTVYWPFDEEVAKKEQRDVARKALLTDVFLSGSNAITMDGKIVNVDGAGNRVVGMIFGPKKAIIVVGINKIAKNIKEAFERIRNVTAPLNAKRIREERGWELLPCVKAGKCVDCDAENRICNVTTIIEKKPRAIDISIIIVGEKLGL